jgi:hypothetical protein
MVRQLATGLALTVGLLSFSRAGAQAPAPAPTTAPAKFVLIPYQGLDTDDPHADAIAQSLTKDLADAGMSVSNVAPIGHIDAVASAAKICIDNNATALLVPDGRYEQTMKSSLLVPVMSYPTHVEFRLDEVSCDGVVRWSTVTTADRTVSGMYSVGNVGATIDGAFGDAVRSAVTSFAGAKVQFPATTAGSSVPSAPAVSAPQMSSYLLLPIAQPNMADPKANDITNSLLGQMQKRKPEVKVGAVIDHNVAVATAVQLCASNAVQGIVAPSLRIEESGRSGRSHAVMQLALLNCDGVVVGRGIGEADMHGVGPAGAVAISERAMGPALDQLFP